MDLNEQAELAVAEVLAECNITLGTIATGAARLAWLAGFQAGADATRKAALAAIGGVAK